MTAAAARDSSTFQRHMTCTHASINDALGRSPVYNDSSVNFSNTPLMLVA